MGRVHDDGWQVETVGGATESTEVWPEAEPVSGSDKDKVGRVAYLLHEGVGLGAPAFGSGLQANRMIN